MAAEPTPAPLSRTYAFGPFKLIPAQHLLLEGDTPVRLGARALALLVLVVERAGELVSKQEILERAWPHTVVVESNIKVAVATLRRALKDGQDGQRYLVNVSGRGYQFVAPVTCADSDPPVATVLPGRAHHLPVPAHNIVGRQRSIQSISTLFETQRLVTIVGEGGMGKTTVAIAVARQLSHETPDAVRFVDLSTLVDAGSVAMALATELGLQNDSEGVTATLMSALTHQPLLLVLDSCEHVLQPTAELVSRILCEAPGVRILATSREPLRTPGESLHRLPPLRSPPAGSDLSAKEALAFSAVQLFVERAAASNEHFRFEDKDAPLVSAICRKLDGVALAIELAATHADAFSLRDLSTLLDDSRRVLALERRGAFPRHASLAATMDWSYRLLPDNERTLLRRLSVFDGVFSLSSAMAVAGPGQDTVKALHGLVSRSMVAVEWNAQSPGYRLLDTTRAYAATKLQEAGEERDLRRRHALHLVERMTQAKMESVGSADGECIDDHDAMIDDVRAALAWALESGDTELATALTVAATPLCQPRINDV
ncbi:Predicted ATPase [Roseateles sp. YR242]|uniref:ATP-binding protein n=1 Tax=Roseateles sp. YR242 TaxID=1855305 RepID=UPI0008B13ACC|nr:winged helix-turn-helix domain-containing protein [Roseateles sp. YR242]SEK27027.1 Predicted ATPase [Roseateles sp. YR242]